jgi:hypothetical protein
MAMTLRGASDASDLDRWTAGEPVSVPSAAPATTADRAAVRADAFARALGLDRAASRRVAVVDDRFHARTVDEVTYVDARGRPVGLVRLASVGRSLSAVRFDYRDRFGIGTLSAVTALDKAVSLATDLGVSIPAGSPIVRATMNGSLWVVTWPRTADGFPVDGDGVTVRIWRSGDVHSVSVTERDLSVRTRSIGAVDARGALDQVLPRVVSGERRADGTLTELGLRWVAANDRYRPDAADAPSPVLRLAYVFEMRFGGPSAELIRAATFWIDAETGELLGGDVLR